MSLPPSYSMVLATIVPYVFDFYSNKGFIYYTILASIGIFIHYLITNGSCQSKLAEAEQKHAREIAELEQSNNNFRERISELERTTDGVAFKKDYGGPRKCDSWLSDNSSPWISQRRRKMNIAKRRQHERRSRMYSSTYPISVFKAGRTVAVMTRASIHLMSNRSARMGASSFSNLLSISSLSSRKSPLAARSFN